LVAEIKCELFVLHRV